VLSIEVPDPFSDIRANNSLMALSHLLTHRCFRHFSRCLLLSRFAGRRSVVTPSTSKVQLTPPHAKIQEEGRNCQPEERERRALNFREVGLV
uniref:Uncharacterized protein n=1 Tax=Parascaris univalens TaxID=6257 RepID=A0A914ZR86_PARUN